MEPVLPVGAPRSIAELGPAEIDTLLDRLEATVPRRPALVRIDSALVHEAIVFGDTHGDYRCTEGIADRWRSGDLPRALIGLGDYIDRAPRDCPGGSVVNALFLLGLAAQWPERVFLMLGNHELVRRLGASPHTLPRELAERWGSDPHRYGRLMDLLERGPLAAVSSNGVYFAHAGFPRGAPAELGARNFDRNDERLLLDLTWPEPDQADAHRGVALPWGRVELDRFLEANRLSFFLRGHDPDLTGRPLYGGRCLTLHSCRLYRRHGGILTARVPLDVAVRSAADVAVEPVPLAAASDTD
jgi:hypothetical protein